jgi:hypothetical protein
MLQWSSIHFFKIVDRFLLPFHALWGCRIGPAYIGCVLGLALPSCLKAACKVNFNLIDGTSFSMHSIKGFGLASD